ncbi:hypothetical protein [Burkholderia diffusa]|uniref:hypothetical protein n=1 Tax=Burkholderia diffusa TaxID=488732 RepID=UPI00075D349B|nr:hypothetical protein [Burkholderia diffusa]KVH43887.1 hypothetical protein WJ39_01790 [Burkholderia diffusa]
MHTVCLPTSVWRADGQAVESFLHCVAARDALQPLFMLADASAVLRRSQAANGALEIRRIEFADWVRIGFTAEGVLDIERIRNDCMSFLAGSVVMLAANGFESDLILRALHEMRIGFFSAARWPKVIAVVCDDPQMFQVAPTLSAAFYLQPVVLNPVAAKRIANRIVKDSKSLRWFGKSIGILPTLLRRWAAKRRVAQERKTNRGLGWVWEE